MRTSRIMVGLMTVLALTLCMTADAGKKSRERDRRDRTLADAQSAFEAGKQYTQSQMYDQAISKFETAVAKFEAAERIDSTLPRKLQLPTQEGHALALMNMGACNIQKGKDYHPKALQQLQAASRLPGGTVNPLVWYNLMAVRTLTGSYIEAIDALDKALSFGFRNYDALRTDEDLYELRRRPEWRATLEKHGVFL